MQWPAFDAELTLLDGNRLLVQGPLGPPTAAVAQVVVFGVVTQEPQGPGDGGTWVRGEVKLVKGGGGGNLPLERGRWYFKETAAPGTLEEGPALAHALRVEMMKSGSIATFGWSQWLEIRKAPPGLTEAQVMALAESMDVRRGVPTEFADVQPNIVRAHVRDHFGVLVLRFSDAAGVREALRITAGEMKTAADHHEEVVEYHRAKVEGRPIPTNPPFVGIGLSHSGYAKLERTPPADPAFAAGMRARRDVLGDPEDQTLQATYRSSADAIVLVGGPEAGEAEAILQTLTDRFAACSTLLACETGRTTRRGNPEPREHFGFVDGISGPRFIDDGSDTGAEGPWNTAAPLREVLVREPDGPGYGSYLVYRKLRQDVEAFETSTKQVATRLLGGEEHAELAGALLLGRHQDGTPIAVSGAPSGPPPANDFDYAEDPDGLRCPVGAHVRRMEGRDGKTPVLARRGQTYGPDDNGEVGVLFMAVMSSIERQFEAIQRRANDPQHFDALIGQNGATTRPPSRLARSWGKEDVDDVDTTPAVHLRGGEYYFLPSVSFLQSL